MGKKIHTSKDESDDLFSDESFLQKSVEKNKQKLERELKNVFADLDISSEELKSTHIQFASSTNSYSEEFWAETVALRSGLLRHAAHRVIDEFAEKFEEDLISYCVDNRFGSRPDTGLLADINNVADTAIACIEYLFQGIPNNETLEQIGLNWQNALYKAAVERSQMYLGRDKSQAESRAVILLCEVELLTETPWMYTDRLLAAFELAHQAIKLHCSKHCDALKIYTRNLT